MRTYYKEVEEKILDYIDCKDSTQGRSVDLPKIEES